jgi:LuxR family maltose regulon positive regulatory protein
MAARKDGQRLPVAGYAYVYLGGVYREWNDLEAAARCLTEGIDLCQQVGSIIDQVVGYATLARVRQAQGDQDGVDKALQNARQLSQRMKGYDYARRWVEDCQVRLWYAQDSFSEVARWIQETDLSVDRQIGFSRELEHIILARALVALGQQQPGESYLSDGLDLLARLLRAAESARWMGKTIEILALEAMALRAQGNTDQALTALERALELAEPEGYVRLFVDEGPPMADLLLEAAPGSIAADYASKLIAAFGDATTDERQATKIGDLSSIHRSSSALVEPLSARELEVLQLIAEGLTNQAIATSLFLALGTVKVHTRNIYGKLGVNSRTQAVAKARALGILSFS